MTTRDCLPRTLDQATGPGIFGTVYPVRPEPQDRLPAPDGPVRRRRVSWRPDALRGRVLLVFQRVWAMYEGIVPGKLPVAVIARELGVTRQAVYKACPELKR